MKNLLIALLSLAVLLTGCTPADAPPDGASAGAQLPSWLTRVSPLPGAEDAAVTQVEVGYEGLPPNQEVRLIVDGTDVTIYTEVAQRESIYDPAAKEGPVALDPGQHTARAELIELPADGPATEPNVIDAFEWEFRIL